MSLNDYLLTGPELTNNLVGVLCQLRKGPVAIMCDIECMFHQFHVRAEVQEYLSFLWWDNGVIQAQPSVYRMRVHLFGAASSPGCVNYDLKHIAAQGQGRFSEAVVERNFYVDNGLTSVSTEDDAIRLVSEVRQLCNAGKLRIIKKIVLKQHWLEVFAGSTVKPAIQTTLTLIVKRIIETHYCFIVIVSNMADILLIRQEKDERDDKPPS
ncbi:hypothetical protein P4O66_002091 [Electrophorus voltai]|uniref:Reverse transcriptase domain-containing protein n=1 Tax=Electrophorus voltai TaxID=2609070 RepID=A0AAD8Z248_9TELE|nr:hypothetical protein P4O66_002091 [Electrophorus voltai]